MKCRWITLCMHYHQISVTIHLAEYVMNFVFLVCKQEINPPTAKDFQLLSGRKPTETLQHALADEVIMLFQYTYPVCTKQKVL